MAGAGCSMCANQGLEDNGFGIRILDGDYADAFLQRRTPQPGYVVAIWKHGHVAEITDLDDEAVAGYAVEVARAGGAVQRLLAPAKMNYQTLGNALPHLHTHIIARYLDDPAPGRPLPWELISSAGTLPEEELRAQVDRLRRLIGDQGH
jgi:diadenosine tetraphosphate (Ap4A) HIT family hydrolase